jgi:hypothetical protein
MLGHALCGLPRRAGVIAAQRFARFLQRHMCGDNRASNI